MTGTPTPRSRQLPQHLGDRGGGPSLLTVTRTSSLPACARRATWIAVASASAVSVFVIDWTTTGRRSADRDPADIDRDGVGRRGLLSVRRAGRWKPEIHEMNAIRKTKPTA